MDKLISTAVFPAFGCRYLGIEREILADLDGDLPELLALAAAETDFDIDEFNTRPDGDFTDELQSQYAVYIISCALSNVLKKSGLRTGYSAGYSMGLYAAFYHAESITFSQGLALIGRAYDNIGRVASELDFRVGAISGLERSDINELIALTGDAEIINVNNRHSFLVAGYENTIMKFVQMARERGALSAKLLSFHSPYHSRFMDPAARGFADYVGTVTVRDPSCVIVSSIDQREITGADEVVRDLIDNINHSINWLGTMECLIAAGSGSFIECGPGKSLQRIARFIKDDLEMYTVSSLRDLIASPAGSPADGKSF